MAEWSKAVDLSSTIERCVSSNVSTHNRECDSEEFWLTFNSSQLAYDLVSFCHLGPSIGARSHRLQALDWKFLSFRLYINGE